MSRAHCARSAQVVGTAERMAGWSRACRLHSQSRLHAQRAQVGGIAPRSWALITTSLPCPSPGQVAILFQGPNILEANPCRDMKLVSRHRSRNSRSRPPNAVATPFILPSPQARSRLHFSRLRPPRASPMS